MKSQKQEIRKMKQGKQDAEEKIRQMLELIRSKNA